MERGFSIIELTLTLVLLGMGLSLLLPAARAHADRMAVIAARETVAAALARARARALARGEASVSLRERPAAVWLEPLEAPTDSVDLERTFRVAMDVGGSAPVVRIRFGPLGLGVVASRSVRFHRGSASARLVISSYGRVTRR